MNRREALQAFPTLLGTLGVKGEGSTISERHVEGVEKPLLIIILGSSPIIQIDFEAKRWKELGEYYDIIFLPQGSEVHIKQPHEAYYRYKIDDMEVEHHAKDEETLRDRIKWIREQTR